MIQNFNHANHNKTVDVDSAKHHSTLAANAGIAEEKKRTRQLIHVNVEILTVLVDVNKVKNALVEELMENVIVDAQEEKIAHAELINLAPQMENLRLALIAMLKGALVAALLATAHAEQKKENQLKNPNNMPAHIVNQIGAAVDVHQAIAHVGPSNKIQHLNCLKLS